MYKNIPARNIISALAVLILGFISYAVLGVFMEREKIMVIEISKTISKKDIIEMTTVMNNRKISVDFESLKSIISTLPTITPYHCNHPSVYFRLNFKIKNKNISKVDIYAARIGKQDTAYLEITNHSNNWFMGTSIEVFSSDVLQKWAKENGIIQ
jgi:hypothetical protein